MGNKISRDVHVVELDLDDEPITLPDGTVLDEEAAERYGREVADRAAARRRAGRPSLSKSGKHSPQLAVRVPIELKEAVDDLADRQSVRPSDILRRALEQYVEELRSEYAARGEEVIEVAKGDIETYHEGDKWKNRPQGSSRASSTHATKAEAQAAGREMAKDRKVEHVIKNMDGTIGKRNSYGNDPKRSKG